ncbi:MAG: VCBS repeat-containing protein, partial [Bacteroidetes bacterium]
ADYDQDGFEDLFVGARSIPGSYGLSPYSFIIKNLGGTGVDVAYQHRFGMVTDADWVDYDGDSDLDLIMCGDWMPVTIIENQGEGVLNFVKGEAGFPQRKGFWRTLEFADVNGDGRLDVFAGNLGTNSLLRASAADSVQLYLGDFDGNGSVDPLIFFPYFTRYMPLGSKDKYLSQLPILKKRFVSYADFAQVSGFADMWPRGEDDIVEVKAVDELRSLLFLSGEDGYQALPLPRYAQALTIRDFHYDAKAGTLYYLGSNQDLVAVRSNAMGARVGMIEDLPGQIPTFGQHRWLHSPHRVAGRAIVPLSEAQAIIITNNNYPYLLQLQ